MSQSAAIKAAKEAWEKSTLENPGNSIYHMFDEAAFAAALAAYMHVMVAGPKAPPPKPDAPASRTTTEHFLALASGHYDGYTMTTGRTGSVGRDVICFQPDPKSSILLPLFMSVHPIHDALTDTQGRKLDVEIKV